jgi:predicted nucleic acid-binding protein
VSRIVLLDSGPLGALTHPKALPEPLACRQWLKSMTDQGTQLVIPEIADYEIRRELLRAGKAEGLARLDALKNALLYAPLTTATMLRAAQFWAQARRSGQPAAPDASLDADVILAAQAAELAVEGTEVVVATMNIRHLQQFVTAKPWRDIR